MKKKRSQNFECIFFLTGFFRMSSSNHYISGIVGHTEHILVSLDHESLLTCYGVCLTQYRLLETCFLELTQMEHTIINKDFKVALLLSHPIQASKNDQLYITCPALPLTQNDSRFHHGSKIKHQSIKYGIKCFDIARLEMKEKTTK